MLCSLSWMVIELVTSIVSNGSTTGNCLMELQESSSLFLTDSEVCFMFIWPASALFSLRMMTSEVFSEGLDCSADLHNHYY